MTPLVYTLNTPLTIILSSSGDSGDGGNWRFTPSIHSALRYAEREAKGMRMEGAAAEQQAKFAAVCRRAGGVADGSLCLSGAA